MSERERVLINTWGIISLLIIVLGFVRIIYKIIKLSFRKAYTNKYFKKFNELLKTKDSKLKEKLYIWLTQNIGHIQTELGRTGVAVNYIPPMANYALTNYQIIANVLPNIKNGLSNKVDINACKDALNRHIGNLKYSRIKCFKELINPFKWVLEGAKTIVTFPLYISYWFGLYQYSKIIDLNVSKGFNVLSGIIAFINLFGCFQGIVVDWVDFYRIIGQIATGIKNIL